MTTLREAAQQALEALEEYQSKGAPFLACDGAVDALRAALAQQDEPVARECSDPMCACRGGPCAECEEGEREKEIEDLRSSLYFYQRRCEALQSWQSKMRDPERTIVCDILANGKTLDPAVAGNRYTTPQQAEPVQEPEGLDWRYTARIGYVVKPYTAPPQRKPLTDEVAALTAQRDALLEVLKYLDKAFRQHGRQHWPEAVRVAAAIKAVEGTK